MTGAELIKWIQTVHAENLEMYIQKENGGSKYPRVEKAEGMYFVCLKRDPSSGTVLKIDEHPKKPTEIMLW